MYLHLELVDGPPDSPLLCFPDLTVLCLAASSVHPNTYLSTRYPDVTITSISYGLQSGPMGALTWLPGGGRSGECSWWLPFGASTLESSSHLQR